MESPGGSVAAIGRCNSAVSVTSWTVADPWAGPRDTAPRRLFSDPQMHDLE